MPIKHNNIKRLIHRANEEISSTLDIALNTNILNFFTILSAKKANYVINRRGTPETEKETQLLLQKHGIVMNYFERKYSEFLKKYSFDSESIPNQSDYRNTIWVCWWQGYNNAPEIVKSCIDSIKRHKGFYDVIVIDENNYQEYVEIPSWLLEKKERGIISRTHLSDYLRLALLTNHGGIWVDSTFFCTDNCFDNLLNSGIWSIKRPGCDHLSIAGGMFANFSFGCNWENRKIFAIIRDFLEEYWKTNSKMVDYLFLDYLIQLSINNNEDVRNAFDSIPSNNPKCAVLYTLLDQKYDEETWNRLITDTSLFKLSWKSEHNSLASGSITYYGKIINREL